MCDPGLYFRSPPRVPEVIIPEDLVVNIALSTRYEINRAFANLRQIALGRDIKKFLMVSLLCHCLCWSMVATKNMPVSFVLHAIFRWLLGFGCFLFLGAAATSWPWFTLVRDRSNSNRTLFPNTSSIYLHAWHWSSSLMQNSLCGAAHSPCPLREVWGSDWLVWREGVGWNQEAVRRVWWEGSEQSTKGPRQRQEALERQVIWSLLWVGNASKWFEFVRRHQDSLFVVRAPICHISPCVITAACLVFWWGLAG